MEGKEVPEVLTTVHRLQPFSPRYFEEGERLFSYSAENCEAAEHLLRERRPPLPFFTRGLSEPEEEFRTLGVEDLCRFYTNPCRYVLNRRLQVHLREEAAFPEDKESIDVQGLERYLLGEKMVRRLAGGADPVGLLPHLRAAGVLPPGTVGECLYDELRHGAEKLLARVIALTGGSAPEPLDVDIRLAGFTLKGRLSNVLAQGAIQVRYARIRGADLLRAWISHLALHLAGPR